MTPKEKAEELIKRYYIDSDLLVEDLSWIQAKECALIAVDEIYNGGLHLHYGAYLDEFEDKQNYYSYWQEVKKEIEKL